MMADNDAAYALSVEDAQTLVLAKRNIDWLAIIEREANTRGMHLLSVQARAELKGQRARYWAIAGRYGLAGLKVGDIQALARRTAAGL